MRKLVQGTRNVYLETDDDTLWWCKGKGPGQRVTILEGLDGSLYAKLSISLEVLKSLAR